MIKSIWSYKQDLLPLPKKAMEKKWIKTEQMLETLKMEPDTEQQYCHYLGGCLRSTHWLEYSSEKDKYGIQQIGLTTHGIQRLNLLKYMLNTGG